MSYSFPSFSFKPGSDKGRDEKLEQSREILPANAKGKKPSPGHLHKRLSEEMASFYHEHTDSNLFWIDTLGSEANPPEYSYKRSKVMVGKSGMLVASDGELLDATFDVLPRRHFNWRYAKLNDPIKLIIPRDAHNKHTELLLMEGDGKAYEASVLEYTKLRKQELSASLENSPSDSELWNRYIRNERVLLNHSKVHSSLADEVISSILECAISKNPQSTAFRSQLIELNVENTKSKKYKHAASTHPCKIYFLKWIESRLEESAELGVTEVVQSLIQDGLLDISIKHDNENDVYIPVVYKITCLLRDSGYIERATAIWQSLAEITLFRPLMDTEKIIPAFRSYWNMETRRFGDINAAKWNDVGDREYAFTDDPMPGFPKRTVSSSVDGDLDSLVLFEDIEPFLQYKPIFTETMLFSMMSFFGAPIPDTDPDYLFNSKGHNADIVVELIRQLTHTNLQLPIKFVEWTFDYLQAHPFYNKYSQHMLKKYNSAILYQMHASICLKNGDDRTFNLINSNLISMPPSLEMWNRWTVDVLTMVSLENEIPKIDELEKYLSHCNIGKSSLTHFLADYLKAVKMPFGVRHVLIQQALTEYWIGRFKYNTEMVQIARVLMYHSISKLGLGTSLLQWHFTSCCELIQHPSIEFFQLLSEFQTNYRWSPVQPLFTAQSQELKAFMAYFGMIDWNDYYDDCSCAAAWRVRLKSEVEKGERKGNLFAAREVYLKALSRSSWNSELALYGYSKLKSVLSILEQDQLKKFIIRRDFRLKTGEVFD